MFNPNRMLSPSNRNACNFLCNKCCSSAVAIVDCSKDRQPQISNIKETTDLAAGAESGQPNRCALLADELRSFFVRDGA